jgi:hypothetical protein
MPVRGSSRELNIFWGENYLSRLPPAAAVLAVLEEHSAVAAS